MNLANFRRKMKEDVLEAQTSLVASPGASLLTSDAVQGWGEASCTCTRTHSHVGSCVTHTGNCQKTDFDSWIPWELNFYTRNFVSLWEASSL